MDQSFIQRIIPHRYLFLFIDGVTERVPGQKIVGIKNFTDNEETPLGYSADSPLVPMGILLEAVTQLGAILVLERPSMVGKIAMILQIPVATLHQIVRLGDSLRVEAEVVKMGERFGEMRDSAYRDGELVAEGQMHFAIANTAEVFPK